MLKAPFVTVAQTGTIGEVFVQMEPCGVNDDCLLLIPKLENLSISCLFIAAAIIRLERWRFNYGRKLTPARIASFKMPRILELEQWTDINFNNWMETIDQVLKRYIV